MKMNLIKLNFQSILRIFSSLVSLLILLITYFFGYYFYAFSSFSSLYSKKHVLLIFVFFFFFFFFFKWFFSKIYFWKFCEKIKKKILLTTPLTITLFFLWMLSLGISLNFFLTKIVFLFLHSIYLGLFIKKIVENLKRSKMVVIFFLVFFSVIFVFSISTFSAVCFLFLGLIAFSYMIDVQELFPDRKKNLILFLILPLFLLPISLIVFTIDDLYLHIKNEIIFSFFSEEKSPSGKIFHKVIGIQNGFYFDNEIQSLLRIKPEQKVFGMRIQDFCSKWRRGYVHTLNLEKFESSSIFYIKIINSGLYIYNLVFKENENLSNQLKESYLKNGSFINEKNYISISSPIKFYLKITRLEPFPFARKLNINKEEFRETEIFYLNAEFKNINSLCNEIASQYMKPGLYRVEFIPVTFSPEKAFHTLIQIKPDT